MSFEDRQEYIHWIQVLDNEYVGFHAEKSKKQAKPKKPFTRPPAGKR